jgi:hypothetical protein
MKVRGCFTNPMKHNCNEKKVTAPIGGDDLKNARRYRFPFAISLAM